MRYFILFIFISTTLFAYDTYIFRVQINPLRSISDIRTFFNGRGIQSERQPFFQTNILIQPDTNYVLVEITPLTDIENTLAFSKFGLSNVDLFGQIQLKDGKEPEWVIDNRIQFPTNKDWSVKTSS